MNNKTHNDATARPLYSAKLVLEYLESPPFIHLHGETPAKHQRDVICAVNEYEALKLALEDALYSIRALDENYDSRPSYVQGQKLLARLSQ